MFEEHRKDAAFGQLMHHMKVVDAKGESVMDEDQWEAASASVLTSPTRLFFALENLAAFGPTIFLLTRSLDRHLHCVRF